LNAPDCADTIPYSARRWSVLRALGIRSDVYGETTTWGCGEGVSEMVACLEGGYTLLIERIPARWDFWSRALGFTRPSCNRERERLLVVDVGCWVDVGEASKRPDAPDDERRSDLLQFPSQQFRIPLKTLFQYIPAKQFKYPFRIGFALSHNLTAQTSPPHPATQTLPTRGPYLPIQLVSTDSVYPHYGHGYQPHSMIHYKRYWNRHVPFQYYAKWIDPRCTLVRRNTRRKPSVCDIIMVGQAYLGRCNVRQESW
jgi:hypothetical protein